jgi:hypothetical protein
MKWLTTSSFGQGMGQKEENFDYALSALRAHQHAKMERN